ncbi:MAG: endonuclease V [Desulfurococcaceae archaeon]
MIDFDYERAVKLQSILSRRVLEEYESFPSIDLGSVKYVLGVDASYRDNEIIGVAVLVDYNTGFVLRNTVVYGKPAIPYIPGLLAFREAPVYFKAIEKIGFKPDIVFVNGHGLSHPRAFGIATHIGLVLGKPSIGVAKKKLFGEEIVIDNNVYVKAHGRIVGRIIEHSGLKLYVSVGYGINLEKAVEATNRLLKPGYKLPVPLEIADKISKREARKIK